MRTFFILFGLVLATPAIAEQCGLHEYLNNTTCTTIDTGYYGIGCTELIPGYTRLEYLNADGKSYIDTGITANQDTSIDIGVAIGTYYSSGYHFYGGGGSVHTDRTFEGYIDKYVDIHYGGRQLVVRSTIPQSGDKYRIKTNKNFLSVTNNITGDEYNTNVGNIIYTTPKTIYLFAINRTSHLTTGRAGTIIYYVKLWDNDVLVRDMIPVQNNTTLELGMYDLVENKFYPNDGDGTFIPGPPSDCATQTQCTPGFYCINGVHMHCRNKPNNSHYTTPMWTTTTCPWMCDDGYGHTFDGICNPLCAAGATTLRTGTGVNVPLFAARNTTPAINVKINDSICYADLVSGKSTNAVNVKYDGQTYHTFAP